MSSSSNRDSNGIRASVFDVCMELGALDDNSLVAEWMFSDLCDSSGAGTSSLRRTQDVKTRFREILSTGGEEAEQRPYQSKVPFSLKASAFRVMARFNPKSKSKSFVPDRDDVWRQQPSPSQAALSRRSFFRRSMSRSSAPSRRGRAMSTRGDSGFVSASPRSSLQHNEAAIHIKEEHVTEDDGDDEWEEIEAHPQSPLYALNNHGINPPPVFPPPKTSPSPSPSPSRIRKPLSIHTKPKQHRRGISTSLPTSPFVLLTSNGDSTMPQPTSRIVFSDDTAATIHTSVQSTSLSASQRTSMGYHNQFFASPDLPHKRSKSVSVPSRPPGRPLTIGGAVPFPKMKK